jgi:predicted RNA-binding Zn ribbon-like protein
VELATYADLAVRLVNTADPARPGEDALGDLAGLRRLLTSHPLWIERMRADDLTRLRRLRGRLREVFEAAATGNERSAVAILNALLAESVIRPQISDHDGSGWHLHIFEEAPSVSTAYAAAAIMGISVQVTEMGLDRLGLCRATGCRRAFVDTTTNRSRRYCSERCASRANVAAYRARHRAMRGDEERASGQ